MRAHVLPPAAVASAGVVLAGIITLAAPRYALGALQLALATGAAAMALHVLARQVPPTGWMAPFTWMSPFATPTGSERSAGGQDDVVTLRKKITGRRQRIAGGPALPPDLVRLMKPLIGSALHLDPDHPDALRRARERSSALLCSILAAEPARGLARLRTMRPDPVAVAGVLGAVLDELHLAEGALTPTFENHQEETDDR